MQDRIVKNIQSGEYFIATSHNAWSMRLQAWKNALRDGNGKTDLPCPMPIGHLMFDGKMSLYEPVNFTRPVSRRRSR